MIAVGGEDASRFIIQPLLHHRTAQIAPQTAFWLQIKTQFVGGLKRGIGRTPGMKTNSVQPMILAGFDNSLPGTDIHGRITSKRKFAAIMRESQVDDATIQKNILVAGHDLAKAKSDFARVIGLIAL